MGAGAEVTLPFEKGAFGKLPERKAIGRSGS